MDVAAAKRIVLKTSTPSLAAYLAADVDGAEPDGKVTAQDVSALKRNGLYGEALPVIRGN